MSDGDRTLLVDASVFITLAEVDAVDVLLAVTDKIVVPGPVANEITDEPAASALSSALDDERLETWDVALAPLDTAANHLGTEIPGEDRSGYGHTRIEGDVGLLALALLRDDPEFDLDSPVVVTDDRPLRQTCKALSIPVTGSIGVLIRAVERGDIDAEESKDRVYAVDEVGARLSASLVRQAERIIDDAVIE